MPPTQGQRPTGKTIQWSINSVHDQNYFDHAEGCANSDLELYSYSEGPERHFARHRKSAVNISRIWFPIQTMHTYLNSARLTGFNSTKNIKILQKLSILEPFYGIRNILDSMCEIADADVFSYISRTWLPIQTANTYLESARLTGSNSTKNIEILQ